MPVFALDFDATVDDGDRKNFIIEKQTVPTTSTIKEVDKAVTPKLEIIPETPISDQVIQKTILPTVPKLPEQANSSTIAPVNTQYSGKVPNSDALIPCSDIIIKELVIDESVVKSKPKPKVVESKKETPAIVTQPTKPAVQKTVTKPKANYRYVTLAKGTHIRAVNTQKITDYMYTGQTITFLTTQQIYTPYFKIPAKTKITARVVDSHRPQMSCNGGLVAFKIVSAQINGYNQPLDAGIIRMNTERVYFSNLKGDHTYWKTTCKKAKWGQKKFSKWSRTSSKLASMGPGVVLAPFPYIGGCVAACASTLTSPITALLGKGGSLVVPANTVFTIKLYEDAKIRY